MSQVCFRIEGPERGPRGSAGGGTGTSDSGTGTIGPASTPSRLRVTWWGSPTRTDRTVKALQLFHNKYPEIGIDYEWDLLTSKYFAKLQSHAAAGTLPDVAQLSSDLGEWAKYLLPLDGMLEPAGPLNLADVPAVVLDGARFDGKLFAVSLGANTQCMVLDAEAFDRAGVALPPDTWTWADFERIAGELHGKLGIWGHGVRLWEWTLWRAIFRSAGTWGFTPDGKALGWTDDTPWTEHWQRLVRLQKAGIIPTHDQEMKEFSSSNHELLPIVGKRAAMDLFAGSNFLPSVSRAAGDARKLKLVPLPRVAGGGPPVHLQPGSYFSIAADSKRAKEAALLIDFFINDVEANEILAAERGVPVAAKVRMALRSKVDPATAETIDLIERIANAALPPPAPTSSQLLKVTSTLLPTTAGKILRETVTPEAGVAEFRREANLLLAAP